MNLQVQNGSFMWMGYSISTFGAVWEYEFNPLEPCVPVHITRPLLQQVWKYIWWSAPQRDRLRGTLWTVVPLASKGGGGCLSASITSAGNCSSVEATQEQRVRWVRWLSRCTHHQVWRLQFSLHNPPGSRECWLPTPSRPLPPHPDCFKRGPTQCTHKINNILYSI